MSSGTFAERQKCSLFHSPRGSFGLWEIQDLKPAVERPHGRTALLPCGRTALLPCGRAALLLCGRTALLPCGRAAGARVLPSSRTAPLPCGRTALLPCGRAALLPCGRTAGARLSEPPLTYVYTCRLPFNVTRGFNAPPQRGSSTAPCHTSCRRGLAGDLDRPFVMVHSLMWV